VLAARAPPGRPPARRPVAPLRRPGRRRPRLDTARGGLPRLTPPVAHRGDAVQPPARREGPAAAAAALARAGVVDLRGRRLVLTGVPCEGRRTAMRKPHGAR